MLFVFTPGQQGAQSKALLNRECYAALKEKGRTKPRCPFPCLMGGGGVSMRAALGWDRPSHVVTTLLKEGKPHTAHPCTG